MPVMGDPRVPKTESELEQSYDEHLTMLADRCDAFYEGKTHEARSIATLVSNLVNDRGKSFTSILTQLDQKDRTRFLDSRSTSNLHLDSARGIWPRTPSPYRQHRVEDLVEFDDWWENQKFYVKFTDVTFTRGELVAVVRNQEGSHVSKHTHEKLALINRSRSPVRGSVKEKDDGTTTMMVGRKLTPPDPSHGPDEDELNEFVAATLCAIAEELLFSLTPEPDNRKRMQHEAFQGPLYISEAERNQAVSDLESDLLRIDSLLASDKLPPGGSQMLNSFRVALEAKIARSEDLTSEYRADLARMASLANLLGMSWDEEA